MAPPEGEEVEPPLIRRRRRTSILVDEEDEALRSFSEQYDHQDADNNEDDESQDNDNDAAEAEFEDDDDKYAKYAKQQGLPPRSISGQGRRVSALEDIDSFSEHSSLSQRAFSSFRHTAVLSLTSNRVDAVLASLGCAGSLALLQWLTLRFPGYDFFNSSLVSSAIKFFFNESPPSLSAFGQSSAAAMVFGIILHFTPVDCGKYSRMVLLFAMFLYWKLQGGLWGAANSLALMVAVESGGWTTSSIVPASLLFMWGQQDQDQTHQDHDTKQPEFPWRFVLLPYLSGHLLLYGLACIMSILRQRLRIYLIRQEFISKSVVGLRGSIRGALHHCNIAKSSHHKIVTGKERRKRLWQLFQRMDTSGDGQLDAVELQVALRAATGTDISIADTNAMIRAVDSDGNGTVDFDEFCASIDKLWLE